MACCTCNYGQEKLDMITYDLIIMNILDEFLGHQPTSNVKMALENLHVHKSPPHVSSVATLPSFSSSPMMNGKDVHHQIGMKHK